MALTTHPLCLAGCALPGRAKEGRSMRRFIATGPIWLLVSLVAAACAAPAPAPSASAPPAASGPQSSPAPKRITVGVTTEPPSLYEALIPASIRGGPTVIQDFINPGLAAIDTQGTLRP